jgi:hypothetical protein
VWLKLLVVLAVSAVAFGSLLIWADCQPVRRPDVAFALLGYTNGPTGTRLACVAITNRSTFAIQLYGNLVEIPAPDQPGGLTFYRKPEGYHFNSVLGGGAVERFLTPIPTNQVPWRLRCMAYTDVGSVRVVKRMAFMALLAVGWHPRYQTMPFDVEGDWIGNPP